jgi:signal transduction histidine kinase
LVDSTDSKAFPIQNPKSKIQNGITMLQPRQVQHTLMAYLRHELCTPIDATIGYSAMLLEELQTQPDSIFAADLRKIHGCSQQLLTLVTTILDPVQLEMSQIDGELSRFGAELRMELLTPLSTIIGYCELLLEEAPAELIPDLDKIHTAAHQLLSLINDIVNLAQQQLQTLTSPTATPPQLLLEHSATATIMRSATTILETLDRESTIPQSQGGMILVVDDNPTNCDLLSRQLKRQGYTVTTANSAKQALRLMKAIAYDLILLDAIMPEVDGLELLQQLKQDDRFKHIPAIVISALETIDIAVKCIELGAEDYLQKPCDPILLQARIATSLEKKRLRDREILYRQQVEHLTATAAAIEERNRIAREIHDSLGHSLTALNVQMQAAATLLLTDPTQAHSFLAQAQRLGKTAMQEVRESVRALRTDERTEQPFAETIAALAEEFRQVTGITPNICLQLTQPLSFSVSKTLYRIVQEALTNISKYAEATQVQIHSIATEQRIDLKITDNGRGFNSHQQTTGFGLQGMQERVAALNGKFHLTTSPGSGCQIQVELPLLLN